MPLTAQNGAMTRSAAAVAISLRPAFAAEEDAQGEEEESDTEERQDSAGKALRHLARQVFFNGGHDRCAAGGGRGRRC